MLVIVFKLPGSERVIVGLHQPEHVFHCHVLVKPEGMVPHPGTGLVQAKVQFQEPPRVLGTKFFLGSTTGVPPPPAGLRGTTGCGKSCPPRAPEPFFTLHSYPFLQGEYLRDIVDGGTDPAQGEHYLFKGVHYDVRFVKDNTLGGLVQKRGLSCHPHQVLRTVISKLALSIANVRGCLTIPQSS